MTKTSKETNTESENILITVPSSEFFRNSDHQYQALKEPMALTKYGKPRYVIMPYEDYEEVMNRRFEMEIQKTRKVIRAADLSKEQLQAIRDARVPPEYEDLD